MLFDKLTWVRTEGTSNLPHLEVHFGELLAFKGVRGKRMLAQESLEEAKIASDAWHLGQDRPRDPVRTASGAQDTTLQTRKANKRVSERRQEGN